MEEYLHLFSETEIFVFIFMEIVSKLRITHHMLAGKALIWEKVVIILIFGGFSIFGTLVGTPLPSGAIVNVRDFAPIIAGLIGGPVVGLGAGLMGGVHRFFMGGSTYIVCGVATILAGLAGGVVHRILKGRLLPFYYGALLAVAIEVLHGVLVFAEVHPASAAWEIIEAAIPPMMIANGLGVMIALLVLAPHDFTQLLYKKSEDEQKEG